MAVTRKVRRRAPDRYIGPGARQAMPVDPDLIIGSSEDGPFHDQHDPTDLNAKMSTVTQAGLLAGAEPITEPWLRLPDEPQRQWRAFVAYRDLGEARTLARATELAGENQPTIASWFSRWRWAFRVEQFDRYIARLAANSVASQYSQMIARHIGFAMKIQELAITRLMTMEAGELSAREALMFLKEGVTIEKVSREMPQEVLDSGNGAQPQLGPGSPAQMTESEQDDRLASVLSILVESGALPEGTTLDSARDIVEGTVISSSSEDDEDDDDSE